jgi:acyl-coenzyme A synthetase/AMP-(fatty) acid ligase
MLARTAAANRGLQITERDVVLCVLPMAFHFVVSILLYMRAGATLVLMPDFLADVTLQTANRHRATVLYATPLHIQLLAALAPPARFETMRRVISTSSALAPDTARAFLERHGLAVEQAYGIIEVGLPLMNCDRAHDRPEALGIPLPDFEVAILDDARRQVPDGTLGELAMRGPGMFSAYVSPPRRRDEVLHDGWFLTGDLARREADGLIVLGGRAKSVINIAGNKVFPEEVERVLCLHTQIAEARVWGRPHPRLGEAVIADVVQRDPKAALDVEALLRHCRAHLSPHKVPLLVNAVDAIDRTQSGKVCRS